MAQIKLETDRFMLREFMLNDAADLFEMDSNPNVHRYLGNQPVKDIAFIHQVIASLQQQYLENGIGRWAIIDKKQMNF